MGAHDWREEDADRPTEGERKGVGQKDVTFICPCELVRQHAVVTERTAQIRITTRGREGV